jgi:hypothetical protein
MSANNEVVSKAWIESSLQGDRTLFIGFPTTDLPPIPYCTFHYIAIFSSNAGTLAAAKNMAKSLGYMGEIENINVGISEVTLSPVS